MEVVNLNDLNEPDERKRISFKALLLISIFMMSIYIIHLKRQNSYLLKENMSLEWDF